MDTSRWSCYSLLFSDFKYTNLGVADCVREIVHIDWLHVGFALVEVQLLDVVLLPWVDVDRFRMDSGRCGREIDFADLLGLPFSSPVVSMITKLSDVTDRS